MNIFPIEGNDQDVDWKQSAISHDDFRCNKMIIESCQMLSTNAQLFGINTRYKKSFMNHPMTIWARESVCNFKNLLHIGYYLRSEFCSRHNKVSHGCDDVLNHMETLLAMPSFRDKFPIQDHSTNMPLCMPDEYKTDNLVESYRKYFANKPNLRYFYTTPPEWIFEYRSPQLPPVQRP